MSNEDDDKAAKKYAGGYGHGATIPKRMHKDICDGIEFVQHVAFLAGIEWERRRRTLEGSLDRLKNINESHKKLR